MPNFSQISSEPLNSPRHGTKLYPTQENNKIQLARIATFLHEASATTHLFIKLQEANIYLISVSVDDVLIYLNNVSANSDSAAGDGKFGSVHAASVDSTGRHRQWHNVDYRMFH
jgi:hypothetical protein